MFLAWGLAINVRAQYSVYALNRYTPLLINPAAPSLDRDASLSFFHDEYNVSTGEYLNTNILNAEYPFIARKTGQKLLGVGLSFLQKDASVSDMLKTYEAGLSLATPIQLTAAHSLHFGMSAFYANTQTSMTGLTTGSQWIASEFRYDPDAGLGESFASQKLNYVAINAGLVWNFLKEGHEHTSVGVSAWNLNQPNESFFNGSARQPITYMIYGQTVLFQTSRLELIPGMYYQHTASLNEYTALWTTRLKFKNENPYDVIQSGHFDLIARYDMDKDLALAFVFAQPGFSAGFSYNFPLVSKNSYMQNDMQIGLSLSKTLWKPESKRIVVEPVPTRRQFDFERKPDDRERVVKEQSEIDVIKSQLEELDDLKSFQFELSKNFKFAFGKAELDPEAYPFLDELAAFLKSNGDFDLKVVGHTDNVGSKNANYTLSLKRAQVVADYLISKGLPASQVEVIGRGDTEPVAANDTEEGKAKNRRVQFIITVNR